MEVQRVFHVEDQVFGSNQEQIGTVVAVTPYYLHVASGLFEFGHDYYIPYDAVKEAEPGMVVLKVPASRISELGWDQEPGEPLETPQFGHYGTMPAPPVELAPLAPAPPVEPALAPPAPPSTARAPDVTAWPETPPAPERAEGPQLASFRGHVLCDASGKRLGKIRDVNQDYLEVSTGLFGLGRARHVPSGHVAHCDDNCCYLDLTAAQLEEQEWRD